MKRLDAMYKCRLCGKEYVECSTGGEKGNQQFVMGIMYRAVSQKKTRRGNGTDALRMSFLRWWKLWRC